MSRFCTNLALTDVGEDGADVYGFVFSDDDLGDGTSNGGGNLGVDFVGGDFQEGFV